MILTIAGILAFLVLVLIGCMVAYQSRSWPTLDDRGWQPVRGTVYDEYGNCEGRCT